MTSSGTARGVIKSVETLFTVVEGIKELDGATVTELADHLGFAPSTTHRYLKTLHQNGYAVKEGDTYHLGLKFLDLGGYSRRRIALAHDIKQTVIDLAIETGELAAFIMEDDGYGVFVQRQVSPSGVQSDARIGKRIPLHLTSGGKAIMANLPPERLDEIIDRHGLPGKTQQSITDRSVLDEQLERTRDRGYAFGRGENTYGLNSVGAPVRAPDGEVCGAVTVAGPTHRMEGERMNEEIPEILLRKVNEFELNFTYA